MFAIRVRAAILVVAAVAGFMALLSNFRAWPQHNAGHNDYQYWSSQKVANCCNNQDCMALDDSSVRDGLDGQEVKIGNLWCPVEQRHRLIRGKSPDWSANHACISPWTANPNQCERLLCFTGKGLF